MKVKYIGNPGCWERLTPGKIYEATKTTRGYYHIVDDTGADCLYNCKIFERVKEEQQ